MEALVKPECTVCKSKNADFVDAYKHLMKEDVPILGEMNLYQCKDCDIVFAYPLAEDSVIDEYYAKTYRKSNRPHYIPNPEKTEPTTWHKAQYSYITFFRDFSGIENLLDFGPGYGFLLREIRQHHPKIKLHAFDPDTSSMTYLDKYQIHTTPKLGVETYDLIILSHCLEHFKYPKEIFQDLKNVLKPEGKIFVEVPNCPFTKGAYLDRPSDGPHFLFFTAPSLEKFYQSLGFKVENIVTAGYDFKKITEMQLIQNKAFYDNTFVSPGTLKQRLKKWVPDPILHLRRKLKGEKDRVPVVDYAPFEYNGGRWTLRSIISL